MSHRICVIGPIARDESNLHAGSRPGGTAHYSALTLAALGDEVSVATRLRRSDETELLADLRGAGVAVRNRASLATTRFENIYATPDYDRRKQRVHACAAPLGVVDLASETADAIYLGPLTCTDLEPGFIADCADRSRVCLDAQGLVRVVRDFEVCTREAQDWPDKRRDLSRVEVVKADQTEATWLTCESDPERAAAALVAFGARVALVTLGSRGAHLATAEQQVHVSTQPARGEDLDPTGCGDVFTAAFLHVWLQDTALERAGEFAAAAATLALESPRGFGASERDVWERAGRA